MAPVYVIRAIYPSTDCAEHGWRRALVAPAMVVQHR